MAGPELLKQLGAEGEMVYASLNTPGAHRLAPVRKRDAPSSSRRGPCCGLAGRSF